MKKIREIMILFLVSISLTACGTDTGGNSSQNEESLDNATTTTNSITETEVSELSREAKEMLAQLATGEYLIKYKDGDENYIYLGDTEYSAELSTSFCDTFIVKGYYYPVSSYGDLKDKKYFKGYVGINSDGTIESCNVNVSTKPYD